LFGQKVIDNQADHENRIVTLETTTPFRLAEFGLTSNMNVGSQADVPGCTVTFSTARANTLCKVIGVFAGDTTSTNYIAGFLSVDGSVVTTQGFVASNVRATATQVWSFVIAGTGSHTVKLRAAGTGATCTLYAAHTKINVEVLGA
jgi:hypothetical protein